MPTPPGRRSGGGAPRLCDFAKLDASRGVKIRSTRIRELATWIVVVGHCWLAWERGEVRSGRRRRRRRASEGREQSARRTSKKARPQLAP
jgi:hypothetical protein